MPTQQVLNDRTKELIKLTFLKLQTSVSICIASIGFIVSWLLLDNGKDSSPAIFLGCWAFISSVIFGISTYNNIINQINEIK